MNRDLQFCAIRGGLEVRQLAAILLVSGRLICKPVNRIFTRTSLARRGRRQKQDWKLTDLERVWQRREKARTSYLMQFVILPFQH